MPARDPPLEVRPFPNVRRVRPIRLLPLVVDHDRAGNDAALVERGEKRVVARLCRVGRRALAVARSEVALRAPAAEDRLAPPHGAGRTPLRDEAARLEILAMPPEPVVRIVDPGLEHDDR